jgi:hypothetical protein
MQREIIGVWAGRSIIGASARCARKGSAAADENERFFALSDQLIAGVDAHVFCCVYVLHAAPAQPAT